MMLSVLLVVLSGCSLFVGVIGISPGELLSGDLHLWEIFLVSRLPRLFAILCTGIGMSVAGLIMQQLCSNKFVSPTTGATISSAQFGILLALLFMPASTLWSRAIFAFAAAILGTWIFVWFIQRIQFKDVVMVPLVGIMFGNVIGGITNYLAYQYEMTQALSSWLVGHFSLVLKGRYEIVWLTVPLVVLAFLFANHFNIVGMGKDFSRNLGVPYNLVLFAGLTIAAMITASIVVVVGSISYIGLIVPNVVASNANLSFAVDVVLMGMTATVIYGWIFKKTKHNVLYVLLVGTVLTSFFGSIQTTLTRVMDPNEYDTLLNTLVASFSNINSEIIVFSLILLAGVTFALRRELALLDVLTLGKAQAINLGVDYDRCIRRLLLGVTLCIAVATAMVGPISFLGLIIANLSRQLLKTFRHTQLVLGSALFGMIVLVGGQLIVEHVYAYSVPVSVFITIGGGLYFLYLLLTRKKV